MLDEGKNTKSSPSPPPGKENMPSFPREQEEADEKPAEGAQADHSGVREYLPPLCSDFNIESTVASGFSIHIPLTRMCWSSVAAHGVAKFRFDSGQR